MKSAADQLRRFLEGRDVPCPACAYNLRGLTSGVCPECGVFVTMEAIRRALRRSAGAAVVIAGIGILMFAVMALPMAAFMLLMAAGMMLGAAVGGGAGSVLVLVGLGVTGLLLFLMPLAIARAWDRWEARIAGLPRGARWGVAALCWSWMVVPLGAMAAL